MKRIAPISITILALLAAVNLWAEERCADDVRHQFDFWLGNWKAVSKDGKFLGHNLIQPIMDQCAFQENWTSANGKYRGTSFNFYDVTNQQWHQTWVDNAGGNLQLNGGMKEHSMVLTGRTRDKQEWTLNRITWTPLQDGRVRQHWEISKDEGKTWGDAFDGYYKRVELEDQ
jgi:hypothetical protein